MDFYELYDFFSELLWKQQEAAGNKPNLKAFNDDWAADALSGGFDWEHATYGDIEEWCDVMDSKTPKDFVDRFKQSLLPKAKGALFTLNGFVMDADGETWQFIDIDERAMVTLRDKYGEEKQVAGHHFAHRYTIAPSEKEIDTIEIKTCVSKQRTLDLTLREEAKLI